MKKKVDICDRCKERLSVVKCSVCGDYLCGHYSCKTIPDDFGLYFPKGVDKAIGEVFTPNICGKCCGVFGYTSHTVHRRDKLMEILEPHIKQGEEALIKYAKTKANKKERLNED